MAGSFRLFNEKGAVRFDEKQCNVCAGYKMHRLFVMHECLSRGCYTHGGK